MRRLLGEFEISLLSAVVRLQDEAYGAEITREISRRTGRDVSPGAVYTGLDRLEGKGFVASRIGEPTPERGGRRKRYFSLRPAGARALVESLDAIGTLARDLRPQLRDLLAPRGA